LRFDGVINLGAVINALAIVCAAVAWLVTSSNNATQTGRDLATLKTDVAGQLKDLRADIAQNIADMHAELKNLPDQRAKQDSLERWVTQLDAKLGTLDTRLGGLERAVIELRADVSGIGQASRAKLPTK
jgi:predicted trehalose synthase